MKNTKVISIGNKKIGGTNPILVQSMCNTDTKDVLSTVKQIKQLEKAGCEIIRVAVLDIESAKALKQIKNKISIPLVADIHYDYKLALEAIYQGVDKIRINPGNIGSVKCVEEIVKSCKWKKIPIRIGINSGSMEKEFQKTHSEVSVIDLVKSTMKNIQLLESMDFFDIVISVKSSDVQTVIDVYRILSKQISYPLHIGVTESGTLKGGTIKSCIGIGALLSENIGDTIRVSLSDNPIHEVKLAWDILRSLKIRKRGVNFISCPMCGRAKIDVNKIAKEIEKYCEKIDTNIRVSIMGCPVNGIGEAKHSNIAFIGGKDEGAIYIEGKLKNIIKSEKCISYIKKLIDIYVKKV